MTLKDKWIEALRSGKYEQGKGALKRGNKFCCLGVLADIQGATWRQREHVGNDGREICSLNDKKSLYWPKTIIFNSQHIQVYLSDMNDEGNSFAQIADWIEKNVTNDMLE